MSMWLLKSWRQINSGQKSGLFIRTTHTASGLTMCILVINSFYFDNAANSRYSCNPTVATEPTTETAVQPTQQTSGEAITEPEEAQPAVESKPTVAPKVAEKKVGRMFCGNSAGEDGLYSACVKDTIKLDNKINITVRTYNSRYVWLVVKNGKKAYYRVPFDGSVEIISKNGKSKIDVTYVKKSPKFGVFLQIDTTL